MVGVCVGNGVGNGVADTVSDDVSAGVGAVADTVSDVSAGVGVGSADSVEDAAYASISSIILSSLPSPVFLRCCIKKFNSSVFRKYSGSVYLAYAASIKLPLNNLSSSCVNCSKCSQKSSVVDLNFVNQINSTLLVLGSRCNAESIRLALPSACIISLFCASFAFTY